jgi:general secretion pathway protein M
MMRLSPVTSRALAVLILLAGIGLIYRLLVAPLIDDYVETGEAIDNARAALIRYRGVAAELPQRQKELALLSQRQATSEGFLQGTNEALVGAQIQNSIKSLVEGAHGELKSTQVLPVQDEGRYRRLTVRAQMSLDIAAAQRVLYGIETATPLLFLDNVDLRAHLGDRRRGRGADNATDAMLDVRMDVYGYMRAVKASADRQAAPGAAGQPSTASR